VIVGPTASGKTAYSIKLAKRVNGEIISADSRQVYKGLDIGTGKVTKREMAGIPHHLLDVANPKKVFTVSDYQKLANKKIEEIIKRGKTPIIVGGTGFYIQAIVDDLVLPAVEPDLKLRADLEARPLSELFALLKKLDPVRAKNIDAKNPRRLIRAIEISRVLGKVPLLRGFTYQQGKAMNKPSFLVRGETSQSYEIEIIGIKIEQEKLNEKIYKRLIERLNHGLIAEAKKLHKQGLSWKRMEELGLEYRYLARHLKGKLSKPEMLEQLFAEIKKYAKRQNTWFKRDKRIRWVKG